MRMSVRDRVTRLNKRYAFATIAALSFVLFLTNVILDFARQRMGFDVTPLFGRVAEFFMLLLSAAAFAVATLLFERARQEAETAEVEKTAQEDHL